MSRRHGGTSPKGARWVEYRVVASRHTNVLPGGPECWAGDQAEPPGPGDGLGPAGRAELARYV
jgi:hypothetical protein